MSVRILLADDHAILRQGLRALIVGQAGFELIAEAADGHSAVRAAEARQPDVAVIDLSMPTLNGIDVTRQILTLSPRTRVIMISAAMRQST